MWRLQSVQENLGKTVVSCLLCTGFLFGSFLVNSTIKANPKNQFEFDKDKGAITDYYGSDQHVEIPREIEGVQVKIIGEYAFSWKKIHSLIISDTVEVIEDHAFSGNELVNVNLPAGITHIGEGAFYKNKLTKIKTPEKLEYIGALAFFENELKTVELSKNVKHIFGYAFAENRLTEVKFPEGLRVIEPAAFYRNELKEIQLPLTSTYYFNQEDYDRETESIAPFEMYGGPDFTYFPSFDEETIISGGIAYDQEGILEHAPVLAENVIDDFVFDLTSGEIISYLGTEKNLMIPNQLNGRAVEKIGEQAFYVNKLTAVSIPDSVKEIKKSAFFNNRLETVTIPDSVQEIKERTFCSNQLKELKVPEQLRKIGDQAFMDNQIREVELPNKCQYYAYYYEDLTPPDTIFYNAILQGSFDEETIIKGGRGIDYNEALAMAENNKEPFVTSGSEETILNVTEKLEAEAEILEEEKIEQENKNEKSVAVYFIIGIGGILLVVLGLGLRSKMKK